MNTELCGVNDYRIEFKTSLIGTIAVWLYNGYWFWNSAI